MDSIVHMEMPYSDKERVAKFYTDTFGWDMQMLGEEMDNYVMAYTTETDEKGLPQKKGTINAGFFPKKPEWPAQTTMAVIDVKDIQEAIRKIQSGGGKVLGEPMEIPGIGIYVSFVDTEGNHASILQSSSSEDVE